MAETVTVTKPAPILEGSLTAFLKSIDKYRYDMIFLLEPWEDIYTSDKIRYESFDQVITIDSYIKNTYKEFGYNPIIVPKDNIKNRVDFIINTLK